MPYRNAAQTAASRSVAKAVAINTLVIQHVDSTSCLQPSSLTTRLFQNLPDTLHHGAVTVDKIISLQVQVQAGPRPAVPAAVPQHQHALQTHPSRRVPSTHTASQAH